MIDAELVATNSGYECRYYPTILSGPMFRWTLPGRAHGFEVSASRDGVLVQGGSPVLDHDGVIRLVQLLAVARHIHQVLRNDDRDTDGAKREIRAVGDRRA